MRIAWLGSFGSGGGVATMGTLLLDGLANEGNEVDVYVVDGDEDTKVRVASTGRLTFVPVRSGWRWNRWYSRGKLSAFLSGSIARIVSYRRMVRLLRERNASEPYDVIFQMSQSELFNLGKHLNELPPVVVFPCVHTAGELRWHRRESRYALGSENLFVHFIVRIYLIYRAWFQRREIRKPAMVIGMSRRFNQLLREDYSIETERQGLIYNPIKTSRCTLSPGGGSKKIRVGPLRLLFVARISVRKGVEQIVELSRRLDDLAGQVELHVIGGATMWSDYRGHLKELNPRIGIYLGSMPHDKIMSAYDEADALVLPSHYEPGGIVVGEALSRGLPVVVNEEIGSAEPVEGSCCRRFLAGDIDAFEREVRALLKELLLDPAPIRSAAREQAKQHFSPEKIAKDFQATLQRVIGKAVLVGNDSNRASLLAAN